MKLKKHTLSTKYEKIDQMTSNKNKVQIGILMPDPMTFKANSIISTKDCECVYYSNIHNIFIYTQ